MWSLTRIPVRREDASETTLTLVKGHRIGHAVFHFPHLCPGEDCAIGRWYWDRIYRIKGVATGPLSTVR